MSDMRVGILTAARTNNNGTDLQALAMQWLFDSFGCQTYIIAYKCKKLENSRKILYPFSLRGIINSPYRLINHLKHQRFRARYFRYSDRTYSPDELNQIDYDHIVVGSDQIWNLKITGNDLNFFLPFDTAGQKLSYAASIGGEDITEWQKKYDLAGYLRSFRGVSVRESDSVAALRQIGIHARHDLDPLLMIPAARWESLIKHSSKRKPYIFVYTVDRTREILQRTVETARKNHCDVIEYGRLSKPVPGVKVKHFPGIEEWLDLLLHADLVITNSYHGLSFAIQFHKRFSIYWLTKAPQSNARMESLLRQIGLTRCGDGNVYDPDWNDVERRLNMQRTASRQYITEMLTTDNEQIEIGT